MKKNRSYRRELKKRLRQLEHDNKVLTAALCQQDNRHRQHSQELNGLRNRIKRIDNQYIISQTQADELRSVPGTIDALVTKFLIRDMVECNALDSLIRVEADPDFHGIGTRYNVSLEVLAPFYN